MSSGAKVSKKRKKQIPPADETAVTESPVENEPQVEADYPSVKEKTKSNTLHPHDVYSEEITELERWMDGDARVSNSGYLPLETNPYLTAKRCLVCRKDRPSNDPGVGGIKVEEGENAIELPVWVCTDCTESDDQEHLNFMTSGMIIMPENRHGDLLTPSKRRGSYSNVSGGGLDPPPPSSNSSDSASFSSLCACDTCQDKRVQEIENDQEMRLLQSSWQELCQGLRGVYHDMGFSTEGIENEERQDEMPVTRMLELFDRLCTKDANQLLFRLEAVLKDMLTVSQEKMWKLIDEDKAIEATEAQPEDEARSAQRTVDFFDVLLREYNKLLNVAMILTPMMQKLESDHLSCFGMSWQMVNQHLFRVHIYAEKKIKISIFHYAHSLRLLVNKKACKNYANLLHQFQTLEAEMRLAAVVWRAAQEQLPKSVRAKIASNKNRWQDDWEVFKSQCRLLQMNHHSHNQNGDEQRQSEGAGGTQVGKSGKKKRRRNKKNKKSAVVEEEEEEDVYGFEIDSEFEDEICRRDCSTLVIKDACCSYRWCPCENCLINHVLNCGVKIDQEAQHQSLIETLELCVKQGKIQECDSNLILGRPFNYKSQPVTPPPADSPSRASVDKQTSRPPCSGQCKTVCQCCSCRSFQSKTMLESKTPSTPSSDCSCEVGGGGGGDCLEDEGTGGGGNAMNAASLIKALKPQLERLVYGGVGGEGGRDVVTCHESRSTIIENGKRGGKKFVAVCDKTIIRATTQVKRKVSDHCNDSACCGQSLLDAGDFTRVSVSRDVSVSSSSSDSRSLGGDSGCSSASTIPIGHFHPEPSPNMVDASQCGAEVRVNTGTATPAKNVKMATTSTQTSPPSATVNAAVNHQEQQGRIHLTTKAKAGCTAGAGDCVSGDCPSTNTIGTNTSPPLANTAGGGHHGTGAANQATGAANAANKETKHCDCCYCEVFGHGPPSIVPMSRNYAKMRERLRSRLNKKKTEHCGDSGEHLDSGANSPNHRHCHGNGVCSAGGGAGAESRAGHREKHPSVQLKTLELVMEKEDHRDLDSLISFIEGSPEPGKRGKQAKATKKQRQRMKKAETQAPLPADGYSSSGDDVSSTNEEEEVELFLARHKLMTKKQSVVGKRDPTPKVNTVPVKSGQAKGDEFKGRSLKDLLKDKERQQQAEGAPKKPERPAPQPTKAANKNGGNGLSAAQQLPANASRAATSSPVSGKTAYRKETTPQPTPPRPADKKPAHVVLEPTKKKMANGVANGYAVAETTGRKSQSPANRKHNTDSGAVQVQTKKVAATSVNQAKQVVVAVNGKSVTPAKSATGAASGVGKKTRGELHSIDEVFVPKDIDLEVADLDESEKELEAFKRFCWDSKPTEKKERVKVTVDLQGIVFNNKKKPMVGCV